MRLLRRSGGSARRSRGSMRSGKSWLGSSANWRRPSVCWRAIAQARRERSRPSRPLHRPRQLLQRSGNAAAGLLRPRNQVTVVAPRQPSAIRCLPWQPAERSTKSLPLVRGLARTMSARPSPAQGGKAASKSATGSYTQAERQRRRNTQRSDSAVNRRSHSSVTADRKGEVNAALWLAATTGGLCFLAGEGQDEGAAVRRGAVLEQEDALPSAELRPSAGDGDAELGLGQRALDVGRHVVRPFVIVAVERDIFWHDAMQKSTEVAPHIGRCILFDQQRRGGVRDIEDEEAD